MPAEFLSQPSPGSDTTQTERVLAGKLGSWQMLQETLVGGTHRFQILPAFFGLSAEQDCLLCDGRAEVLLQDWGSDVAE